VSLHETAIGLLQPDSEALLRDLGSLARLTDCTTLQEGLVTTAARLARCALSQLYLLDETGTGLTLTNAWSDGQLQGQDASSLPRNYFNEPLLQFCLGQKQSLNIPQLNNGLYQANFLPDG
jgi:sigma-54-dependent transcriptional regulator